MRCRLIFLPAGQIARCLIPSHPYPSIIEFAQKGIGSAVRLFHDHTALPTEGGRDGLVTPYMMPRYEKRMPTTAVPRISQLVWTFFLIRA